MIELTQGLRIVTFDIETTDLDAYFGQIVCCTFKPLGKKPFTIRIDSKKNPNKRSDKWVVEQILDTLERYDVCVGWYSQIFDKRFINTRSLLNGVNRPFPLIKHRDLCLIARAKFATRGNSLKMWSNRLRGYSDKTVTTPDIKRALIRLEPKAMNFVVEHCIIDVRETEANYEAMLPYLSKKLEKK